MKMKITEAIQHCREVAAGATAQGKCPECAADHAQLADWLEELVRYKCTVVTPEDLMGTFSEEAILRMAARVLDMMPERLQELAQAEKDGRLVVIPDSPIGIPGVPGDPPGPSGPLDSRPAGCEYCSGEDISEVCVNEGCYITCEDAYCPVNCAHFERASFCRRCGKHLAEAADGGWRHKKPPRAGRWFRSRRGRGRP